MFVACVCAAAGHCIDIHSHIVSQGLHYVPGPNSCTVCICDKGSPKWCKSVLCSPPQDCQSFQAGNSCCEFKCLDDILGGSTSAGNGGATTHVGGKLDVRSASSGDTYDVALRLIASLVTAVLSLSLLFFLIHRLRRKKSRGGVAGGGGVASSHHQLADHVDHRHQQHIGYITGGLGYLSGSVGYLGTPPPDCDYPLYSDVTGYPLWKPAGSGSVAAYFPRGEAPPPYEEAVRAARAEAAYHQHQQHQQTDSAIAGNPVSLTLVHNTHVNITQQQQQHGEPQQLLLPPPPAPASQPQLRLVCRQSKSLLVNQVDVHSESGVPIVLMPAGSGRKRGVASTPAAVPIAPTRIQQQRREPRPPHRTIPSTVQPPPVPDPAIRHVARSRGRAGIATKPDQQRRAAVDAANARRSAEDSDLDDYRSECENCKSLSLENCSEELLNETMTLQRHPAEPQEPQPPFYRTSLTLPVHPRKLRTIAAHRDSWFMPMQELSSSSDDE